MYIMVSKLLSNNVSQNMDPLHRLPWVLVKIQISGPCSSSIESKSLGAKQNPHFNELTTV